MIHAHSEDDLDRAVRWLEREKLTGHCGESTTDAIARDRFNDRIDALLSLIAVARATPTAEGGERPDRDDYVEIILRGHVSKVFAKPYGFNLVDANGHNIALTDADTACSTIKSPSPDSGVPAGTWVTVPREPET